MSHASADLREQFKDFLDLDRKPELQEKPLLRTILDRLRKSSAILPAAYCDQLDIPRGSRYSDAVKIIYRDYFLKDGDRIPEWAFLEDEDH